MAQEMIYNTAWRGIGYWLTEFRMGWDGWERLRADSGLEMYLEKYRGCRDAYGEAMTFLSQSVIPLPTEQRAQALEEFCEGLCTDPDLCDGYYEKGKAEQNRKVVVALQQEIAALRERFGAQEAEEGARDAS